MQENNRRIVGKEVVRINIDSPLHCPHDLIKQHHKDNLPTLLNCNVSKDVNKNVLPLEQTVSACKIFNDVPSKPCLNKKLAGLKFLGPFERYKLIRPFLQAEADKEKIIQEKAKANDENDPSVQDRIAALHDHFIQVKSSAKQNDVAQKEAPIQTSDDVSTPLAAVISLDTSQPLISMPGSKKRKRDESDERFGEENSTPHKSPKKRNIKGQHGNGNGKQNANNQRYHNTEPPEGDGQQGFKKKKKNKKPGNDNQPQHSQKSPRGGKNYGKHQHFVDKPQQNAGRFMPDRGANTDNFDYSKVDYSQFGGGGKAVGHKQFESKHRGKGQNKRGGGFVGRGGRGGRGQNQSMTFQPTRGRGSFRGRK